LAVYSGGNTMMVVSPVRCDTRVALRADTFAEAVHAVGTAGYGRACFRVLEQVLDVDHWALFRYRAGDAVKAVAMASRAYQAAAEKNVSFFVNRCYRFDPSLIAYKRHPQSPCIVKMGIGDIYDRQYRHCFEVTNVRERLSFFATRDLDLYQLCVYHAAPRHTFSPTETRLFATLARLIVATASKHEALCERSWANVPHLDIEAIEDRLKELPTRLSKREREVCARAAAGKTIEDTALELDIRRTSVITYRQRAYVKLGVSRQSDLAAIVYNGPVRVQ